MELNEQVKCYLREVAGSLRGFDRRLFMARTVRALGADGQRRAERELGRDRVTVRKATHEPSSGIRCQDAFCLRGRRKAEAGLPDLLTDVRSLANAQSQIDPTFDTQRLYTRLSAAEIRRQLVSARGYADGQLPSEETIRRKMHQLGYRLKKVAKSRSQKSCPRPTPSSPN